MEKLQLNDASLVFFTGKFGSISFGFVVDFRNAAHGDYSRTSRREFNMTVITTVPNVSSCLQKRS
jgi:translation elongation factor EF-4